MVIVLKGFVGKRNLAARSSAERAPGLDPEDACAIHAAPVFLETKMEINIGYVWNELKKALEAEEGSEDAIKAGKRVRMWNDVLNGILGGALNIGTRKPTMYPVWVTPEIVRGGFSTGKAAAAYPLLSIEEEEAISDFGAPHSREALFFALLSDEGLSRLRGLLEQRKYKIGLPEEAALLVIAWLYKNGHTKEAERIAKEISQYSSELRFLPETTAEPLESTDLVFRFSAKDIRKQLLTYGCNRKIETQREALKVWIPFMDRLVLHWGVLFKDSAGKSEAPPAQFEAWKNKASGMLSEYENLKEKHTLCRKYHKEKENLKILITATRSFIKDASDTGALARARHVVFCHTRAHGEPNGADFIELRKEQARIASLPGHELIANALADRIQESDSGISDTKSLLSPVLVEGCDMPVPLKICKIISRAQIASIPELIGQGIVPSAEVMAGLAPQLTAFEISKDFSDEDLGVLLAETFKAFCRRRSLLLMDLSSQIRFDELPWVKPMIDKRLSSGSYTEAALRLAAYAIDYFPGVVLPNPLVEQLNALYSLADGRRPFLAELAADIFTGRFTQKYDDAALTAAGILQGSLYDRYYCLGYENIEKRSTKVSGKPGKPNLSTLLEPAVEEQMAKSGEPGGSFIVRNGMMIERAQIITTHNLATLVVEKVKLEHSYNELALLSFAHSCGLITRSIETKKHGAGYLHALKNAAYAWRQALFFLSLSPEKSVEETMHKAEDLFLRRLGPDITQSLFNRLKVSLYSECSFESARPFFGWVSEPHWMFERDV